MINHTDLFYCVQALAKEICKLEDEIDALEENGELQLLLFDYNRALENIGDAYTSKIKDISNFPSFNELVSRVKSRKQRT